MVQLIASLQRNCTQKSHSSAFQDVIRTGGPEKTEFQVLITLEIQADIVGEEPNRVWKDVNLRELGIRNLDISITVCSSISWL